MRNDSLIHFNASKILIQNVADGEPQILYSLYGIVVHSGTMRSGHYTAYVKVRPEGPKLASNGLAGQGKQILASQ